MIVIGCPVANRGWILQTWIKRVRTAAQRAEVDAQIVCLTTPSTDDTDDILKANKVTVLKGPDTTRHPDRIKQHLWGDSRNEIQYMATLRNQLLDYVRDETKAEWFFSLDSDILLPPEALALMLMWASLRPDAEALSPRVNLNLHGSQNPSWNYRQWRAYDWAFEAGLPSCDFYEPDHVAHSHQAERVDALMAAMFIRRSSFDLRWAFHPQGEDIAWNAAAHHHKRQLYVVPDLECPHLVQS